MPILTDPAPGVTMDRRSIRLDSTELPDFNADVAGFRITTFDGWFDGLTPVPVLVANGGGAGAVAVGLWESVERPYLLGGYIDSARIDHEMWRRALLTALPTATEAPVQVLGNGLAPDRQVFVRCYGTPTMSVLGPRLTFTLPLVAPDPYKYALEPLEGTVGAFAGADWYREYADDGAGSWGRVYTDDGAGGWYRTYQQIGDTGPYPTSLGLESEGDATSRRVTVTVVGPLTAGWWVENQTTGARMWADLTVAEGQTLVFDCHNRSAALNGADVSHLVFGDYLTLAAGANVFRLIANEDTVGYATVSALPAYL